jgi:fatty acid desaturase
LFWLLPYLTVWRVINRLRSVAEHGGLMASDDRRIATHSVEQHWAARFFLVPFNIGFHLAHHVDAGVPFRNLPKYHQMLTSSSYVPDQYPNYRSLWTALHS